MDDENKGILTIIRIRFGWLLLGLIVSLFISKYIHQFEEVLQENILVVTFIPLVVYLADAIGTQMESIIIRTCSRDIRFNFSKFFYKQMLIVLVLGILLGGLGILGSYLMYSEITVSLGLGFAIFIAAVSALITGTIIPYLFWKLHKDPAEASGPIATVIQVR